MALIMAFLGSLPEGFVYLKDVAPDIRQSMRYATFFNSMGGHVEGYKAPEAILTKEAAEALRKVQQEVAKDGYSLVVYDAYRPQKAVDSFVAWQKTPDDPVIKSLYYPHLQKPELFQKGYIATKSSHSRGSTVDLTLIRQDKELVPLEEIKASEKTLEDGQVVPFLDDGTLDMESHFDFFGELSHHDSALVSREALKKRNYLRDKMRAQGFKEYPSEWWHYTLEEEPFPETYFDFDVQ